MTQFSVMAILLSFKTKGTEIIFAVPFALNNYRSVQSLSSAIFLRFLHCPPFPSLSTAVPVESLIPTVLGNCSVAAELIFWHTIYLFLFGTVCHQ